MIWPYWLIKHTTVSQLPWQRWTVQHIGGWRLKHKMDKVSDSYSTLYGRQFLHDAVFLSRLWMYLSYTSCALTTSSTAIPTPIIIACVCVLCVSCVLCVNSVVFVLCVSWVCFVWCVSCMFCVSVCALWSCVCVCFVWVVCVLSAVLCREMSNDS